MVTKILMPRLSLTMKEGRVGKWYKKEGDTVEKGEPLVEIVSEKATYDLETPVSGILRKLFVQEGVDASVNAVLGIVTAPDEILTEADIAQENVERAELEPERQILASPAAKRLARERRVDLSTVKGSGPDGRIDEEDVRRTIEMKEEEKIGAKTIPLTGLRKTSAERVAESFRTAPHSTIAMEVDASKVLEAHQKAGFSYTALLLKAVSEALVQHPLLNSTLRGDQIVLFGDVNIGVATATENGLIVPVVRNADRKTLKDIDAAIADLSGKARLGKLSRDELTDGTFTITNLGMFGVDFFTPIINPHEAAILGVGRVVEKPVAVKGEVVIRPIMVLTLSYDHRIIDGAPAAAFLGTLKEKIEKAASGEN